MEFKGTKGDWIEDIGMDQLDDGLFRCIIHTGGSEHPAHVFGKTPEECEANAKIVSSAKEVLEALRECVEGMKILLRSNKNHKGLKNDIARGEKALNKALK